MTALAAIIELAVGQSVQLATAEGRWVTCNGVDATAGGGFVPIFTAGPYTQPGEVTGTVTVGFNTTIGMSAGDWLFIRNGGYYAIVSVGPASAVLRNLGLSTSVAPLTNVAAGQPVTLTGPPTDPNWFDVRLYGATPADIGPGIAAALAAATANKAGSTVFIPALLDGTPWHLVTAVTFNAAFATGDLTVVGDGAWIQDAGIAAFSAFMTLSTVAGSITVRGLIFSGRPGGGGSPGNVLNLTSASTVEVDDCQFSGCQMLGPVVTISSVQTAHVHDCIFGACGSSSTGTIGLSDGCNIARLENLFFSDGVGIYGTAAPGTVAHIYAKVCQELTIANCFFDEIATNDIWLDAAAGDVRNVAVRECVANRPIGGTPFIVANTVQSLTVEKFTLLLATGTGGTVAFDLSTCGDFHLEDTNAIAGAPNQIACRTANRSVRLDRALGWDILTTGEGFAWPLDLFTIDHSPRPTQVGPMFVDPANVTTFASDANTGRTANNVPAGSGPILTTTELNVRLYERMLSADSVVTYLSDDESGTGLDFSTMVPSTEGLFTLTFVCPTTVLASTSITSINAINPATGQREHVKTGIVAMGPFVVTQLGGTAVDACRFVDTQAGPNLGNTCFIVELGEAGFVDCEQPVNPTATALAALSLNDTVNIVRGGHLTLAAIPASPIPVVIQDAAFLPGSVGATNLNGPGFVTLVRCSHQSPLAMPALHQSGFMNAGYTLDDGSVVMSPAGAIVTTAGDFAKSLSCTGNTYITGYGLQIGPENTAGLLVSALGSNDGMQVQDTTSGNGGITAYTDVALGANPTQLVGVPVGKIWGTGQASVGVCMAGGATGVVPSDAAFQITVTGTGGDLGFMPVGSGAPDTNAWSFDDTAGTYVNKQTASWANFYSATPGKLLSNAHHPLTNAHVVAQKPQA